MSEIKSKFYKTLNNLVGTNRIDNEEAYIINDYISSLENIINELEIEANKNIQVCNNRGYNLISSIDEVKTLDDFTINEYIGYLVSLEILDKLNELKGDSSNE